VLFRSIEEQLRQIRHFRVNLDLIHPIEK